MEGVVGC